MNNAMQANKTSILVEFKDKVEAASSSQADTDGTY
jgi:hypothetical protein